MVRKGLTYGNIQLVAVLYLVVWTVSPPLEIDLIFRLLALVCAAVWIGVMIIRQNPIVFEKEQIWAIFFMLGVILIAYIEKGDLEGILRQISFFMLVICFLMNYFYRYQWDELQIVVPVVLVLLIAFNFKTVSVLLEDPTIARKLVRDDESIYSYLRQGVGGYSLVYPQVCVFPAVLAWVIKAYKNNKKYFAIGCVWLISYILLVLNAGYAVAVFSSAAGALLLFFYKGKSGIKAFLVAAAVFAGVMLAILYLDSFREWLLEIFDGTAVAKKINDLVASSDSGDAEGSIQARVYVYSLSIQRIFQYPFIGALWRISGNGHSAVIDAFAKYGVLGGFVFVKILYSVPNYYKKKSQDPYIIRVANATLVSLMIVSILDTVTYAFSCMILIVLPLFFENIKNWSELEE